MSVDEKSSYYDVGGIEVMDVLKAKLTSEQLEGYFLGNIIKYSLRMNHKGSFHRDNEKVGVYSELLKSHPRVSESPECSELEEHSEYLAKECAKLGSENVKLVLTNQDLVLEIAKLSLEIRGHVTQIQDLQKEVAFSDAFIMSNKRPKSE